MKRYISIFLTICILLSFTIVYANESPKDDKLREKARQIKEEIKNRMEDRKRIILTIKPYLNKTAENRRKIRFLTEQSKQSYKKAKNHIKELIKYKDSLTDEQLTQLKDALENLKDWNEKINNSVGAIREETKTLREARRDKNYKEIRESYKRINRIQNSRIDNLKIIIQDLNNIAKI